MSGGIAAPAGTAQRLRVGLLAFDDMLLLDLVGPWEVFSSVPAAEVLRVAPARGSVTAAKGWRVEADCSYADCPPLDVLCVPGGPGVAGLIEDETTLDFLRRQARAARIVSSVCTGSLVLGAAGLLRARRATCHWMSLKLLESFGAVPVDARVVEDGPFVTGGGVTAGIDFGLHLVARLWGTEVAERIQLSLEYAPAPPFQAGSPHTASPALVADVLRATASMQSARESLVARAAARLLPSSSPNGRQP